MLRKRWLTLGAWALLAGSVAQADDKGTPPNKLPAGTTPPAAGAQTPAPMILDGQPSNANPDGAAVPEGRQQQFATEEGTPPPEETYGPTPLPDVKILQNLIFGDDPKPCLKIAGWADFDYTYRSTGRGINNVAPVMNRFGDEFLARQLGLWLSKPLDPEHWSWGFNVIFIAGADAAFLTPTVGGWKNTDPRFGTSFTDLNLTAHLPILTDGGVDVKAGRQTTILGPMGALPWQRYFDSSDYAWYNMEEGRYTGVSAVWHVTKRLDWYNGFELGWGTFYAQIGSDVDYITNISYWLDEEAKKTKVWTTVLTGPTSLHSGANTTVLELGIQHNWNKTFYQIVDSQMVWSKGPVNAVPTPGYNENAYDVYTYFGAHINKCLDVNTRFEWYDDVDGLGYAGGFGVPHTNYYEITAGPDYHPTKWVQFRPEIRYDWANHDNFGRLHDKKDQLSLAAEVLLKF